MLILEIKQQIMLSRNTDLINIFLIAISFIVAIFLPFKLFLFSYAVLGPLHYLTEINWLHEKKYYLKDEKNRNWVWFFVLAAVLLSVFPFYSMLQGTDTIFHSILGTIDEYGAIIIISCLFLSLGLIIFHKSRYLVFSLIVSLLISFLVFLLFNKVAIIFGYFLTTIVHVYLFTLLFMIFGSIKSKSNMGWIASAMVLIVPLIIIFLPIDYESYSLSGEIRISFEKSNFLLLGKELARITGTLKDGIYYVLSENGLKIQMFISFAYTYHYLNWFSKTTIIGWGKAIDKRSSWIIIILWIASVTLYAIDYKLGLVSLFFLSFLHVFAEFPLNWLSIREIFKPGKYK